MKRLLDNPVPGPVVAGVFVAALIVIGFFMWKVSGPQHGLVDSGRAAAMKKAWLTNPAFRKALLKKYPHLKGP